MSEANTSYSSTIKITEHGARMEYTKYGAGCVVFALGLMVAASLFCLYISTDSSLFRAVFGVFIGVIGLIFFGSVFLHVVLALSKGKVLLEFDGEYLTGRRGKRVAVSEITAVVVGRHSRNLYTSEDLVVKTQDGKVHVFSLYNLLSTEAVRHFIITYITPICGVDPKMSDVE